MAIDQTKKQLNLVDGLVTQATLLDDVLDEVASLIAQYAQAGTVQDATLLGSELKHIDAGDVTTLIGAFDALVTHMNEPGQYRRDIFRKVRK